MFICRHHCFLLCRVDSVSILVVNSFDRNLRRRRDANFFVFGQLCRFIHKLASRCAHPVSFPANTDWFDLLAFDLKDLQLLPATDFLKRLKLRKSFEPALVLKTERDNSLKSGSVGFAELLDKTRSTFATQARSFFLSLLTLMRDHVSFSSDITQGLACFDPQVLFRLSGEQATRCFKELHSSFHLRNWVPADSLSLYQEEYMEFRDHLRIAYPDLKKESEFIPDMVDFLTPLSSLRSRKHLLYLYELSCLCLTEPGSVLPAVKFGSIDSSDYKCVFASSIEPVQSYLSRVPAGVTVCASESTTVDFLALLERTSGSDFDASYDPWTNFDLFDRKKLFKTLESSHKSLAEPAAQGVPASIVSSTATSRVFVPFPPKMRKVAFGGPKIPKKGAKKSSGGGEASTSGNANRSGDSSLNSSRRSSLSGNEDSSEAAKV